MAKRKQPPAPALTSIDETQIDGHLKTRPVAIRRIARFIANLYGPHVDMRDLGEADEVRFTECLLTRCLAAHAVAVYAGLPPPEAARCVVDGGQDLGIDAIALDESQRKCWLFQAKFQQSGRGNIEWTEMAKFLAGFDKIISENFDDANSKILALKQDLRRATSGVGWKYVLVLAATSPEPLAHNFLSQIKEHLAYQDPGNEGTFTFENFTLTAISGSMEKVFDAAQINLKIELHDWGCISEPFVAYYGRVPVAAVIQWKRFGAALFDKNLRNYDPSSQIVESISRTLVNQSKDFWYFNNGATILCEKISRSGPYSLSQSREKGNFECSGVSVVNGAQTVGSIWDLPDDGADLDPLAMVHLRLISLENAPADFAQQVTKATNFQKAILPKDFATLDAAQGVLRREFQLDGRTYVFRGGDPPPSPSEGCTIEEVATAVACARSVDLATTAYRNPGFLTDPDNPVYKAIFGSPEPVRADEAWVLVKILRESEIALLKHRDEAKIGRERQVATHGKRYIQHRVFNDSAVKSLRGPLGQNEAELKRIVKDATSVHLHSIHKYILENHEGEYLQVVFKNTQKVKAMELSLNPSAEPEAGGLWQPPLFRLGEGMGKRKNGGKADDVSASEETYE